ncbi:heat shock protein 90-6, mitochondrial, partial [Tanacetum coccineum]
AEVDEDPTEAKKDGTNDNVEGEVESRSILYVPAVTPIGKEDIVNPKTQKINLYVKRVNFPFASKFPPLNRYLQVHHTIFNLESKSFHQSESFLRARSSNNAHDSLAFRSRSLPPADWSMVRLVTGLTWS